MAKDECRVEHSDIMTNFNIDQELLQRNTAEVRKQAKVAEKAPRTLYPGLYEIFGENRA